MGLNDTPRAERVHISLFGKRNTGKSSLINALTGQEISLVSEVKGTTTDPVYKAMELLPIGPVVFIDTAGLDDYGDLGEQRKKKTYEVLDKTDLAILVFDSQLDNLDFEINLINTIKSKNINLIGVVNKIDEDDIENEVLTKKEEDLNIKLYKVSAKNGIGIKELKKAITNNIPNEEDKFTILGDLVAPGDFVVLVVPIDKAAPKGRLILPQQQTIRDILESDAIGIITKEHELKETLSTISKKPKLVITDSQAFLKVCADTPKDIKLTSFSILFARLKGDLPALVKGVKAIKNLQDNDKILIAEACTHHQQSDDIGTVKIPRWLRQMTGKKLIFEHASGIAFNDNLKQYKLVVHCGGCMLNKRAMKHRINIAIENDIPIVNYGVLIAFVQGILERALEPFPLAKMELYD